MAVLDELPDGSSSSSSTDPPRYDVFLSFRGSDTRKNFTAHLYAALTHANIDTFLDDEEIEMGKSLKPELVRAIKASRASVIVLSDNYATSTWCLDELVLILDQLKTSNHVVYPIFYYVQPTDIRWQQNSFRNAMDEHKRMMKAETNADTKSALAQKIKRWQYALTEVANLKGSVVDRGRPEVAVIKGCVKFIYRSLRISSRFPLPQLFGMDNSIKYVTSWLKDESSNTADILTIFGMGGIGKTSLAKYVYAKHAHGFDTSTFIEEIGRRCAQQSNGLLDLTKELCDEISKPSSVQVRDVPVYTLRIENVVAHEKVFLVLDDIDSLDQLDALLGSKGFHPGSKIIITTKNASLTQSCKLFKKNFKPNHETHKLEGLSEIESQKILCFHAFMCDDPKAGYEEVTKNLVDYCDGHAMALKVAGRALHDREVAYWKGYIDTLRKENGFPIDTRINAVLRVSFDSLPFKNDKDLFKHIACFFVGMDKDVTATILEACNIETNSGITNLIDRCLLDTGWNNELMMHQLVQEMGRFVVCQEPVKKPWKQSRLWGYTSFEVLKQKKGSENVQGLALDMGILKKEKLHGSLELKTDALRKMDSLMLLQLNYVQIEGSYENLSEQLRWLCLHGFPLESIPSELPMDNLVALDMSYSKINSFGIPLQKRQNLFNGSCSGGHMLPRSLKILNLGFCEQLHSVGGFDQLPALERLILTKCISLHEVSESIKQCDKLFLVDMSYCNKLENLPIITRMLDKVTTLLLEGCNLSESRIEIKDMDSTELIKANNTSMINTETASTSVVQAIPRDSKRFVISLPRSLISLSLANTNLSTESFPVNFGCLSTLRDLYLDKNPIVVLPACVRNLPRLEMLSMQDCKMLTSVKHPPHTLTYLNLYSEHKSLLRKVVFDTRMLPLDLYVEGKTLLPSSFEFQGVIKIQPMAEVEEKVLRSLGWTKLDIINERGVLTSSSDKEYVESEIQMYYEFGIFSTIYGGEEMPNWITDSSMEPSISFTIPSSHNRLRGLNFCSVQMPLHSESQYLPMIIIRNTTKTRTWIYHHYLDGALDVDGNRFTFLSHWMFGMNDMEVGDQITITVRENGFHVGKQVTKTCGVSFVYDDGEEDVLGYYKSWNHIIGGYLKGFLLTTGEYVLNKGRILMHDVDSFLQSYLHLCGDGTSFKDKRVNFRAFSQKESSVLLEGGHSASSSQG